jgi:SRSO17 transposase
MSYRFEAEAQQRVEDYIAGIYDLLGDDGRRTSFATYFFGLLGEGERKSVEPIVARAIVDPDQMDAAHQRLLHFLNDSPWCDWSARRYAARYAIRAMQEKSPIDVAIIDDTGMLKQGKHSVGVQRQYTGSAGKITNCQLAVSLSVANGQEQLPVDFDLYLPRSWSDDTARRHEARIPDGIQFRTKPQIALELLRSAIADQIPLGVVLADAAYGNSSEFRKGVRALDLDYAMAIDHTTKVFVLDDPRIPSSDALSVRDLALRLCYRKKTYRRVTWRAGTAGFLTARFAFRRVVAAHDDGHDPSSRPVEWLVAEWLDGEEQPTKFYLVTLRTVGKKHIVRLIKERWRTERVYEELKGELGFDHFEGRRWPGWQHHVSVVLAAYAFVVAERARSFPPSATREDPHLEIAVAA